MEFKRLSFQATEQPEAFSSEKARRTFAGSKLRNGVASAIMLSAAAVPPFDHFNSQEQPPQNPVISAETTVTTELTTPRETNQAVSRQAERQDLIAQQEKKAELKHQQTIREQLKKEQKSLSPSSVKDEARDIIGNDKQFKCFDSIVDHESDWNPKATNPESGAYGLVQALPADKMASAGADWKTNPKTQIK